MAPPPSPPPSSAATEDLKALMDKDGHRNRGSVASKGCPQEAPMRWRPLGSASLGEGAVEEPAPLSPVL